MWRHKENSADPLKQELKQPTSVGELEIWAPSEGYQRWCPRKTGLIGKLVFQWNHHWPHCAKCRGWTLTFNWIRHKKSKPKKLGYRESVGSPWIFIARRPLLGQKKGIWKAYKQKQSDSMWRSFGERDLMQHGTPKKQWLRGASKEEETEASSAHNTLQFHKLPQGGIQIDSKQAKSKATRWITQVQRMWQNIHQHPRPWIPRDELPPSEGLPWAEEARGNS